MTKYFDNLETRSGDERTRDLSVQLPSQIKNAKENSKAFKYQIDPDDGTPYKKKYDPRAWLRAGEVSMVERFDEAFQDLGSVGKTLAS